MPVPHQTPNNLPLASSLPKVSFRKISDDELRVLSVPAGVQDQHHVNFGFNDGSEFEKPDHYLRHVEPIESELNKQVEYDMDEQDQEWLDALNLDRRREQLDAVPYEVFEIIIDRLEKEWFDLMKLVPQKPLPIAVGPDGEAMGDGNEDIECAICDDGECENSNAIVFCDGCNLAVHQDCYGIPYIPEGQWLCRKCTVSPDRAVSCVLCPHEGGAFKQTTQGKWAHLLCAMWIPETGVSNPVYMEPIDSVERIPKARWRLQCYICRNRHGACIQCDNKSCFTAFHVTCGRKAGLLLKTERQRTAHTPPDEGEDENDGHLRAWCHKHLPRSIRAKRAREEEFQDAYSQPPSPEPFDKNQAAIVTPARKKSARAYRKSYRMHISLVPAYVVNRVNDYISRVPVRKKAQLIVQIAKFWSLKREARRGAPLLKRLHLEPWTATSMKKEQSDMEKLKKLRFLLHLREDLEKVRMLAEMVRKREREKQKQAQAIRTTLIDGILFPYNALLRAALERIAAIDRSSLFLNPVSTQVVPDYYDVIKHPMDWTTISHKLDAYTYTDVQQFKNDVVLVLENAMLYNKVDTPYHRTAARILHVAGQIFVDLEKAIAVHGDEESLQLEPEEAILDLLIEGREEPEDAETDLPNDIIEELTNHSYFLDEEVRPKHITNTHRKGKAGKAKKGRITNVKEENGKKKSTDKTSEGEPSSRPRRSFRSHNVRSASLDKEEAEKLEARSSDQHEPSDLEVKEVDNHDSFTRFNVGWVLPEGQKRSRVKPRADSVGQSDSITKSQSLSNGLESSGSSRNRKRTLSSSSDADGGQMKRSKSTSHVPTAEGASAENEEIPRRRGHPRQAKVIDKIEEVPKKGANKAPRKSSAKNKTSYEPGTLCWAKMDGYPFYPSEVIDENDEEEVPKNVTRQKPLVEDLPLLENGKEDPVHLVRFFDSTRTFGWVQESKLKFLFEDDELDQKMLKDPRQPRQKSQVRASYDRAWEQTERE
ncbi:hypothetical protein L7F22_019621 [Adiantum nelumboides]|nr:hypothetical protein [Adiantum nelumboides]